MNLHNRLKDLRKDLGLKTNQEYALFLDYKHSTLNYTLRGEVEPKVGLIVTLLKKVKNLNPYWLLFGEGERYFDGELPTIDNKQEQKTDNTEQKTSHEVDKLIGKVELLKELLTEKEGMSEQRNTENQLLLVEVGRMQAENKELKVRNSELTNKLADLGNTEALKESAGA